MRNTLPSNELVKDPKRMFELCLDHTIEICRILPINEKAFRVVYKKKKEFIEEHSCSNIIISLWTTR